MPTQSQILRGVLGNSGMAIDEALLDRILPVYILWRAGLDRHLHGDGAGGLESWFMLPPHSLWPVGANTGGKE
jgi:hypothetical protein